MLKLSLSYTSAKTLRALLNEAINTLESATNHKIMTAHEVKVTAKARKRDEENMRPSEYKINISTCMNISRDV